MASPTSSAPTTVLAIILPAYNEAGQIGTVLDDLPDRLPGVDRIERIVVDDGSRDATGPIARTHGAIVVRHRLNRGVGLARRTGLAAARAIGATVAVTLDADGQHDPDEISTVIAPVLAGQADLVVGSRLMNPAGMPPIKRLVNRSANLFLRLAWGIHSTDSQSGFRAYRVVSVNRLRLRTSGYEADTEILIAAQEAKFRVIEVPIRAIYTEYSTGAGRGQSLLNSITIVLRLIIRTITG
ncbi:glycosyltransferase family 2 protein [Candidatus Berkelbacteria bacterium]|nr:glycosyltransferase family 2 protein [Candidatus Berkelbacteria bacterium]